MGEGSPQSTEFNGLINVQAQVGTLKYLYELETEIKAGLVFFSFRWRISKYRAVMSFTELKKRIFRASGDTVIC